MRFTGTLLLCLGIVISSARVGSAVDVVVGGSCAGVQEGTKFTNAENCRTFIICNEGSFELWFCPSGFYNPLLDECDLDYKCRLDNAPETDGETTVTPPIDGEEEVDVDLTTSTTLTTVPEVVTPPESTVTISSTTEAATTTTDSTPTSPESTTEEVAEVEGSTSTTTTESSSTTTEVTPTQAPIDGYSCPLEDTDEPTYLNDKKDCEKYYLCYHSEPIEMQCIMGMYWNSETKKCDYPQNVICHADKDGDASTLPKCTSAGRYSMPHPRKCENFIMCMDGEQSIQQCDVFHHWDLVTQKCVVKDQAVCVLDVENNEN